MPRAAESRWEAPDPVEPPSLRRIRALGESLVQRTGIRMSGWVCLLLGSLALVMGWTLCWVELRVVGIMAVALVVVSLAWTLSRPHLEVVIGMPQRSVVVGSRASAELVVRNAAWRRNLGSRLDVPVGDDVVSVGVPSLAAGASMQQRFRISASRRGVVRIGPAESIAGDPFALTGRRTQWTDESILFVHPETVALPGRYSGFAHDLEGHASAHISSADMNFHALRPYAPGDERRHIHWRTTARTGSLMVRQFEESRMSRVVLALDTGRLAWLDAEEFELGVSCVGSVALQTLLGESPLALLTSTNRLASLTPMQVLDELAGVELGAGGGVAHLARTTRREDPGASVVVFITGSSASMAHIRQAGALFDVDTRVIGIRIEEGSAVGVRTAANVSVVQVGVLDDLPRGIRRAME